MKNFGFLSVLLAASASLSAAAPTKRETNFGGLGPLSGLMGGLPFANGGQEAVAELFKGGDAFLNLPGDAITKMLSGDPLGALTSTMGNVAKLGASLPGDAAKIAGMGGAAAPKE